MPATLQQLSDQNQRLTLEKARLDRENRILQRELARLRTARAATTEPPASTDAEETLDVCGFRLPGEFAQIGEAIEASRALLELGDDWDGQGTPGFSLEVWRRTVGLVVALAHDLRGKRELVVDDVQILPGEDGGLAIDWRTAKRELLITVPKNSGEEASFYGDDGVGGHKVKGTLDPSASNRWIAEWLAE